MAPAPLPAMPVSISWRDASGSPGESVLHVPAATTIAALDTAIGAITPLLIDCSDCTILGYSLARSYFDAAAPAPVAGGRVERRAVFGFRTTVGKPATVSVPGVKPALVAASGGILTASAAVAALVAELLGGIWSDSNGDSLAVMMYDEEKFKGTSKRQRTTDISPTT